MSKSVAMPLFFAALASLVIGIGVSRALEAPPSVSGPRLVTISPEGDKVALSPDKGPCKGHAKYAEFIPKKGEVIPGCWVVLQHPVHGVLIGINWFDGEEGRIPVALFKPDDGS